MVAACHKGGWGKGQKLRPVSLKRKRCQQRGFSSRPFLQKSKTKHKKRNTLSGFSARVASSCAGSPCGRRGRQQSAMALRAGARSAHTGLGGTPERDLSVASILAPCKGHAAGARVARAERCCCATCHLSKRGTWS